MLKKEKKNVNKKGKDINISHRELFLVSLDLLNVLLDSDSALRLAKLM